MKSNVFSEENSNHLTLSTKFIVNYNFNKILISLKKENEEFYKKSFFGYSFIFFNLSN